MQYRIHEANYPTLRARLEKLIRRANKLGVGKIAFKLVSEEMVEELRCHKREPHRCEDLAGICSTKAHVKYLTVELEGERPKISGWEFLATLQHAGEAGTVVRAVPDSGVKLEDYRDAAPWCEHCKAKRVRRDTFIVYSAERRETKQVGSTCIKDFLGHADPHAIASYLEALAGAADLLSMGGGFDGTLREPERLDLEQFLATTSAHIRANGWTSRTKARDEGAVATADSVMDQMLDSWRSDRRREHDAKVTEADVREAEDALAWAQAIDLHTDSDYLANILVVSRVPGMELRSAGLAASIVASYRREIARQREAEARLTKGPGAYVGEEKQRLELTVRVDGEPQLLQSNWGPTWLYHFEDEGGNSLVWFASGKQSLEPGEAYRIKATVKRHSEFRGRNQTQLTRVKVLGQDRPDADAGTGESFDDLCREHGVEVRKR